MIIHKSGDLFSTDAPIIAHGINCHGLMAKGIAVQFKSRFPEMYLWYKDECRARKITPGHCYMWYAEDRIVANISSQWRPGRNARYDWAMAGMREMMAKCEEWGTISKVGIPLLGSGIGGLNWDVLETKIQREFGDHKTDIEVWTYE